MSPCEWDPHGLGGVVVEKHREGSCEPLITTFTSIYVLSCFMCASSFFFFFNKTKEIYFNKKFLKLLSFSVKFLLYIGL